MPFLKKQKPDTFITIIDNITLRGDRVLLRAPRRSDWQAWRNMRKANEAHLKPFEPEWPQHCHTAHFFENRLKKQMQDWQEDRANYFLIFKTDDRTKNETLIGGININHIHRGISQNCSLGYWIDQAHEGQGYMREAMLAIIGYCFKDLGLHRIHAACLPHNARSKNLLLRCGFAEEGYAQSYLKIAGYWQDHILFGYTRERWTNA
ncbi:MAG: GNAT family N-acetyltransferase [Bdellovibrionales bacterium]